jgi:hypothetical protein
MLWGLKERYLRIKTVKQTCINGALTTLSVEELSSSLLSSEIRTEKENRVISQECPEKLKERDEWKKNGERASRSNGD